MYVVVNNFNSDKFTKLLNNTKRYSFFYNFWQRIHHSFKFLVHINDRLLKVGLLYSNVNQRVCHTDICMQSTKNTSPA